jgi:hypothetical protein
LAFSRKHLTVAITLGVGQFGDTGGNTVTLTGLRAHAEIQALGGGSLAQLQLRVYGLPLSLINQLTSIGPINAAVMYQNSVSITVGDDANAINWTFSGTIWKAWGDFDNAPDSALNIHALTGLAASLKPVAASSYPTSADVGAIMQSLSTLAGLSGFINHGVSVQLSNPYFPGTAIAQIRECAEHADINWGIFGGTSESKYGFVTGRLEIWPKGGSRNSGGPIPLVSPETGMIGWPRFSSNELIVRTLFNPQIEIGGPVQVQSSLPVACGTWYVSQVTHTLDSETPDGNWLTNIVTQPYQGQ